jgi:peptide chain release factor subunit 1
MDERLRRLARFEPGDLPVISAYLDVRPEATGQKPGVREGLIVLRDRLREIRKTFGPRGADVDSFEADAVRINAFVDEEMDPATEGLAIFACKARGLWEVVEAPVPFDNEVEVGDAPDLFQLARMDDEFETAVVAVIDTNSARLFVRRHGRLDERPGPDDDPVHYQKRATGGWSQKRYQRHIDKHRRDFTGEIGEAIAALCDRERAEHVIIAGDEPAVTPLMDQLPERTKEQVRRIVRIDMRANRNEIAEEIEPILREIEAEEGASNVERAVAEVRRGGLGAAGRDAVVRALERGQVDLLLIEEAAMIGDEERAELIRLAGSTGADVEVVRDSEPLRELGGVAALLRYRV